MNFKGFIIEASDNVAFLLIVHVLVLARTRGLGGYIAYIG